MKIARAHRFAATAIAVTITLSLTACSSGGESSGAADSGKLKSILFVNPLPNQSQWKLIGKCMKEQAAKKKIPFTQTGPTGSTADGSFMVTRLQQGIANSVGAVATFPLSAEQFAPVLQQAKDKKILTATLFGGGSTDVQDVEVGVGYDDSATAAANTIAKSGKPEKVGILVGSGVPPSKIWSDAFIAAAKKTDNVKVVDIAFDDSDPTKDVDVVTNMLTTHPEITNIATNLGAASPGISAAIKESGRKGEVFFTGNGADEGGIAALNDGTASTVMMQNLCQAGQATVDSLEAIHAGKDVPDEVPVELFFASKETYKAQLAKGGWL